MANPWDTLATAIADAVQATSDANPADFAEGKVEFGNNLAEAIHTTNSAQAPIGSIIAWHPNIVSPALTLPSDNSWVQCDGQTLVDSASPLDGEDIPDLNGFARFLRGSATSGINEAEDFLAHAHKPLVANFDGNTDLVAGATISRRDSALHNMGYTGGGATRNWNTESKGGAETRPINMSVVWIMRVK